MGADLDPAHANLPFSCFSPIRPHQNAELMRAALCLRPLPGCRMEHIAGGSHHPISCPGAAGHAGTFGQLRVTTLRPPALGHPPWGVSRLGPWAPRARTRSPHVHGLAARAGGGAGGTVRPGQFGTSAAHVVTAHCVLDAGCTSAHSVSPLVSRPGTGRGVSAIPSCSESWSPPASPGAHAVSFEAGEPCSRGTLSDVRGGPCWSLELSKRSPSRGLRPARAASVPAFLARGGVAVGTEASPAAFPQGRSRRRSVPGPGAAHWARSMRPAPARRR